MRRNQLSIWFGAAAIVLLVVGGHVAPASAQTVVTSANQHIILNVNTSNARFQINRADGVSILGRTTTSTLPQFMIETDAASATTTQQSVYAFGTGTISVAPTQAQTIYAAYQTQNGLSSTERANAANVIVVEQLLTVVRDAVRIEYRITNRGTQSHTIGARMMLDTDLANTNGATFVVPGYPVVTTEQEFDGSSIPNRIFAYDNPAAPTMTALAAVGGDDATLPSRALFVDVGSVPATTFPMTPNPLRNATTNGTMVLYYPDQGLGVGETRSIVAYFGLGDATTSFAPAPAVALVAPRKIQLQQGDDPSTPNVVESFYLQPKTFTVTGAVYNNSTLAVQQVRAFLLLPPGLTLASNDTVDKSIGSVGAFAEGTATWTVNVSSTVSGPVQVGLSISGAGGLSRSVQQTIYVEATPHLSLVPGIQMFSVPFNFTNPAPSTVLGPDISQHLARWIPLLNQYVTGNDPELQSVSPGQAYWTKPDRTISWDTPGAQLVARTADYTVSLQAGWNQIGDPFPFPVALGALGVRFQGNAFTFSNAVAAGLIRGVLWEYDTSSQSYVSHTGVDTAIRPTAGYWIRALIDCSLVFPASDVTLGQRILTNSTVGPKRAQTSGGWALNIQARAGGVASLDNYLGVSSRSVDGYDPQDLEEPPVVDGFVTVRFPHRDWGDKGTLFSRDIRSLASATGTWDMEVVTDRTNQTVTLTWPNVQSLPSNVRVTLYDLDGGRAVYLRTNSSYEYNSGQGGVRRFQVIVDANSESALRITGIEVMPSRGGGYLISYQVSHAAGVELQIRTLTGKIVRTLGTITGRAAGINTAQWDGRDGNGRAVPRGLYMLQLTATTAALQQSRAVRTLAVTR